MRIEIDVKDETEGNAIKRALEDPAMKAAVLTVGFLLPLSRHEQGRVLGAIYTYFAIPKR